jgi:uncharacterized protein YneF (UPF0154 family)
MTVAQPEGDRRVGPAIAICLLIVSIGVWLCILGGCLARKQMESQAVKQGRAEYFINTNSLQREWRWKP